ncbi:MAG: glycosyltransferase [Candidatus Thiodiazotropha sp.]
MADDLTVIHQCSVWLELTQTWLYNLVRYLPDGIDNHIVCRRAKNLEYFPSGKVHALKRDDFSTYLLQRAATLVGNKRSNPYLDRKIREYKPAILHSHFGNNGWKALPTCERHNLRHFVSFYGQDVSKLPRQNPAWLKRYNELFESPLTRFLCEGKFMAQSLVKMGCDPTRIHVHHLGVEITNIPYRPRSWIPGEPLKVLLAASFREKKGLPYALQALARLKEKITVTITIIGDAGKGKANQEEKHKIIEVIKQHNLGSVTRLLGYQPQSVLWREAEQHHLFLSPSVTAADGDSEGGAPVALIEMAASGMPIVSSRHCDIPDVIREGETGWLAEERDVESIVAAIEQWIGNPNGWSEMLDAGRAHVEQNYDAQNQGQKLAQHYRENLRY